MNWSKNACLILHAAVHSCTGVQMKDGVDWSCLPTLVEKARRGPSCRHRQGWHLHPANSRSLRTYKAIFRCIKVLAYSRWHLRELVPSGAPHTALKRERAGAAVLPQQNIFWKIFVFPYKLMLSIYL